MNLIQRTSEIENSSKVSPEDFELMSSATFLIDQRSFTTSVDPTDGADFFRIKSVPRPYSVIYDEAPDPTTSVNLALKSNPKNLLFIDARVYELYGKGISHPEDKILKVPATEEFKTIDGMLQLVNFMSRHQITKGEKLIVVGGGIIQDVGAFASAVFKRGIPWVFFPTTLLSQCDSCIGGKTGLNHQGAKNQLALFSAPTEVIINPNFLKTLTSQEIKSGLGEILKLHITGGREFLDHYKKHAPKQQPLESHAAKALILGALAVKKIVIEEDEFELNLRRSLNYGHTFGHAIEVLSDYRIPHGQAVAIGLILANEMSFKRGLLSKSERDELKETALEALDSKFVEIMKTLKIEGLLDLLKKDKKTAGAQANFIVLHKIGDTRVLPVQLDDHLVMEISASTKEVFH
jgi:3-dehydroquinate synthase